MFRDSLKYLKKNIVQPKTANFNKIINLKFSTSNGKVFEIKTPKIGSKPDIEISGSLTPNGYAENFEIRVKNLYISGIESDLTTIEVSAGYADKLSSGLFGTVTNCYTANPSPDKETVILCTCANIETWSKETIDLKLEKNFTLSTAVAQIANKLGYAYFIESSLMNSLSSAPFYFNGRCSVALNKLKTFFPKILIESDGKKITVYSAESKMISKVVHTLKIFLQSPQFSGGVVSLSVPFNPVFKCGDFVRFPTTFASKTIGSLLYNEAQINSIQFSFGTVSDTNEMILSCTPTSKIGA